MGRIKSLLVKRTAKQLLAKQPANFNEDFEKNKRILSNTMPSKSIKNKIAGYIARLKRMKRDEAKRQAKIAIKLKQREEEKLRAESY